MKSSKKLKIVATLILILMFSIFAVRTIADNNTVVKIPVKFRAALNTNEQEHEIQLLKDNNDYTATSFYFVNNGQSHNLFKDNPIYCIDSLSGGVGTQYKIDNFSGNVAKHSQEEYALALPDNDYRPNTDETGFTDYYGTKQNLMWYYYDGYYYGGGGRNKKIKGKAVIEFLSTANINKNALIELNKAEAYENYWKGRTEPEKLNLKAEVQGNNIKISWNKLFLSKQYDVYVNGAQYNSYNFPYFTADNSGELTQTGTIASITIPANNVSSIKVVAKDAEIVRAGYYTLTSRNKPTYNNNCK